MNRCTKKSGMENNTVSTNRTLNAGRKSMIKTLARGALVLAGLFFSNSIFAQSIVIPATEFREWWSGHAPFYIDSERNALGIDSSVVAHQGKSAFADTWFPGGSGVYDISLVTLGDINGESEYRVRVNGAIVGRATNAPVNENWGEQIFLFENIELHKHYDIRVEAKTFSNELITENGEFAFSRGHWRSLEITLDEEATGNNPHDVGFISASSKTKPDGTEAIVLNIENRHAISTASGNVLTATASENTFYHFIASGDCGCNLGEVVCHLPDIAPLKGYTAEIVVAEPYPTPFDTPYTFTTSYPDSREITEYGSSTISLDLEMRPGPNSTVDHVVSWDVDPGFTVNEPIDLLSRRTFNTCEGPDFSIDPVDVNSETETLTESEPSSEVESDATVVTDSSQGNSEPAAQTESVSLSEVESDATDVSDSSQGNGEPAAQTDSVLLSEVESDATDVTDSSQGNGEPAALTNADSSQSEQTNTNFVPDIAEANSDTDSRVETSSSGGGSAGFGFILLLLLRTFCIPRREAQS